MKKTKTKRSDVRLPCLGSHMSIAGGYYKAAVEAAEVGCDCVQLFTKNNNQWKAKPITDEDVRLFRQSLLEHQIIHPISHASYLINLASPNRELWEKSIESLIVELERAEQLGIPYVVVHPGAFTTSSEPRGIQKIAWALNRVNKRLPGIAAEVLLENTAGQGSNLGWRFEQLEQIILRCTEPQRIGVCIDTCHAFAAGYHWHPINEFQRTKAALKLHLGLDRIKAIHMNDSLREFGSRVDRHAHIGHGHIGREGFRNIMNDTDLIKIPMYLETAKGENPQNGKLWDVCNLQVLRNLARPRGQTSGRKSQRDG